MWDTFSYSKDVRPFDAFISAKIGELGGEGVYAVRFARTSANWHSMTAVEKAVWEGIAAEKTSINRKRIAESEQGNNVVMEQVSREQGTRQTR